MLFKKSITHDFHSTIFRKTQSPPYHLRRRQFQIFYTMKMFEQTVENKLEDSSGEYETAAERTSRNRRPDAVRGIICDVTRLKCRFLGPRMATKNYIHARRDMEETRQSRKSPCVRQKHFALLPGRPEDPGLVTREPCGEHPARHLGRQLS